MVKKKINNSTKTTEKAKSELIKAKAKLKTYEKKIITELKRIKEKVRKEEKKIKDAIKKNPEKAMAIATGIGAMIGALTSAAIVKKNKQNGKKKK